MKLILAIMIFFSSLSGTYPVDTVLSVVTNYAYIYKEASFTSEKMVYTLDKGETVTLLNETLENNFYKVRYKADEGYIYKECVAVVGEDQAVILTYNAKTNAKTKVYSLSSQEELFTIEENTELYLYEGYHRNSEYTAVKFSHDGQVVLGYIKTIDISPYGVSNVLIISVSAIIACVGVIMILLGINKKKMKISPIENDNTKKEG